MKLKKFLISDIEWDTDGEKVNLPTKVYRYFIDEEDASDSAADILSASYLSDEYGYCIFNFKLTEVTWDTEAK
jgi:hypothetical protein